MYIKNLHTLQLTYSVTRTCVTICLYAKIQEKINYEQQASYLNRYLVSSNTSTAF